MFARVNLKHTKRFAYLVLIIAFRTTCIIVTKTYGKTSNSLLTNRKIRITYISLVAIVRIVIYLKFCNPVKNHSIRKTLNTILQKPITYKDIFSLKVGIEKTKIKNIKVLQTYVDGKLVYNA